jgi:adenylylsulfate kinase
VSRITPEKKGITRSEKEQKLKQKAIVIWLTGLSGSGKTTLSIALENELFNRGFLTQTLDGDIMRAGLNKNLGFSQIDREENIRRIAEISKLLLNCGIITICAFVSPNDHIRTIVKEIVQRENLFEIYVNTPIDICESRDVKGLYAKARRGEIANFTGISSRFEAPTDSDLVIDTTFQTVDESVSQIINKILHLISV